ncbi:MAG: MarC family protein [Endozoicomonas sp.]
MLDSVIDITGSFWSQPDNYPQAPAFHLRHGTPSESKTAMSDLISYAITLLLSFFAIMNPVANTAIFIGLTGNLNGRDKKTTAIHSTALAFVIVSVFCLLGKLIFTAFSITIPAFRITGGILVFLIGKEMLSGKTSEVHTPTDKDNRASIEAPLSIAISPLATPILAGPGTIAAAMSHTAGKGPIEILVCILVFASLCIITCIFFLSGERFLHFLGESAVRW